MNVAEIQAACDHEWHFWIHEFANEIYDFYFCWKCNGWRHNECQCVAVANGDMPSSKGKSSTGTKGDGDE